MSGFGAAVAALNIGAKLTGVTGFFKRVPRWVWIALAVAAAIAAGTIWHHGKVHAAIEAAKAGQKAADDAAFAKRLARVAELAQQLRRSAEAASAAISKDERNRYEETHRRIAADADDLRVRGPGAAASHCRPLDHPGLPAAAGGSGVAAGGGAAAAGSLPGNDRLALVPWSWLVHAAEQADESRSEVLTWRDWYVRQSAASEKSRGTPNGK